MVRFNRLSVKPFLQWVRHIKTWQLVVMLVFGVVVSATLLRVNNMTMDKLRRDVSAADVAGDTAKIKQSLIALQNYVSQHMNTSLGSGVYLPEEYARAREAAIVKASSSTNPNATVYQQASVECRSRFQGGVASFRNDYVTCVAERVKSLGVADDPSASAALPNPEDYHHNFVSPLWTPDLAGLSVLFCIVLISVIVIRAIVAGIIRLVLHRRFKSL